MAYNKNISSRFQNTAGKITILTVLSGVAVFLFFFVFNLGQQEFQRVSAQSDTDLASTTLTVLNTPPEWEVGFEGREEFESSTTSPTNSFDEVAWIGTATDANEDPYFLIICSTSATPTPNAADDIFSLGTAPPECGGGTQWAISGATVSGAEARAATTTTESAPFGFVNNWYAWVCDDDPENPRCSDTVSTGTAATNTSPFFVNPRPVFSAFGNNGPVDPGATLTFTSTSSDAYTPLNADLTLLVCSSNSYSTSTNTCDPEDEIASTTISIKDDATAEYTIPVPTQDSTYDAYGFLFDQFGHSAVGGAQGTNVTFTVNNVAPTVAAGDISLNNIDDILLTVPGGETTGFTLDVTVSDANSCLNTLGDPEIEDIVVSIFRSGVGTTTCDGTADNYDPRSCYTSGVDSGAWNLNCTASSTSCTHTDSTPDETVQFSCEFPLWFVADPTVTGTPFAAEEWVAAVAGVDDNNATGTLIISDQGVDLLSFVALDLLTSTIAYDSLEPGQQMDDLTASSTLQVLGNTGLNQELGGDSMCGDYSPGNPCAVSSTSTIPQDQQRYATSTVGYGSGTPLSPTSSPAVLDIRIPKPTATSTPTTGTTYWGIAVPGTINLSGDYTGQNIFIGVVSPAGSW